VTRVKLTVWRDDATLAHVIEAAGERHELRPRLYLAIDHDGDVGYGEVAVQPAPLNGDPSVDDVVDELVTRVLPRVVLTTRHEGEPPEPARAVRLAAPRPKSRFAVAPVEMALLDLSLRRGASSLRERWPSRFATPCLATVSLLDEAPWDFGEPVARMRVKTRPGPLSHVARSQLADVGVPVILDFNASATDVDDVVAQVDEVVALAHLVAIEQPFAPGNLDDHADLASRIGVAVSLDEGVRTTLDLEQIARRQAASMVCVKPARVGGVVSAHSLIERAHELGLTAYLGGFFESAFARGVHRVLAESVLDEPSDLALVARADFDGPEVCEVPDGLGFAPGAEVLARAHVVVTLG